MDSVFLLSHQRPTGEESVKVVGRACGKIILLGEHFVMTGKVPALSFPVKDLFCEVELEESEKNEFFFKSAYPVQDEEKVKEKMRDALQVLLLFYKILNKNFKVFSETNFPVQRGFGSSGSFSVALCKSMADFLGEEVSKDAVLKVEALFHANPSGVDTETIFHEKPIQFIKGEEPEEITNNAVSFVLVDSGERAGCSELNLQIKKTREEHPQIWESLCARMREVTETVVQALKKSDTEEVTRGVLQAQDVLATLGLSTKKIDEIIKVAMNEGALAGKVSGAGAGGAVLLVTKKGEAYELAEKMKAWGASVVGVVE